MNGTGVAYALLAATFGGCYVFSIKRYLGAYRPPVVAVASSGIGILVYLPVVAVIPPGEEGYVPSGAAPFDLAFVLFAVALGSVGYLLFLSALSTGDVSYVTPLGKIVPAFVLPLELLLFSVVLGTVQVLGVLVLTVGLYVTSYRGDDLFEPIVRLVSHRSARLAVGSAAVYGVYDLTQRVVLQDIGLYPQLWVIASRMGIVVLLSPIAVRGLSRRPNAEIALEWRSFALVGALNACLGHFGVLAFATLPASVASPLVNTQSIVAVVLGGILLGERAARYRLVGACLTVTGVAAIVAG